MADLIYLMMAYAAFWILSFALIFSIFSRQKKLDNEVAMLKQLINDNSQQS